MQHPTRRETRADKLPKHTAPAPIEANPGETIVYMKGDSGEGSIENRAVTIHTRRAKRPHTALHNLTAVSAPSSKVRNQATPEPETLHPQLRKTTTVIEGLKCPATEGPS